MADDADDMRPPLRIDPDAGGPYPLDKIMRGGRRGRDSAVQRVHETAGRMPPQAPDAETSVLGAMMLDPNAISKVIEILPEEVFYSAAHQQIYAAMRALYARSEPVDLVTLTHELRRNGTLDAVGGAYYITELTGRVASAANVEHHARIVAQKGLLRRLIETATLLVGKAYDPASDAFELLDEAERDIFQISDGQMRRAALSMKDVIKKTLERLDSIHGNEGGITGVTSGLTRLDALTGGWQKSDLIIVAARPSMGKCLGRGTRVMMHDGTTRAVEEVVTGDLLMGDDSAPRRVLSLARGREEMVWVRQRHGMDYRVNASHILSLKKSRSGGATPRGTVVDVSVRDVQARAPKWRNDHKGYKVAVDWPSRDLSIDPYILGLWLGDGRTTSSRIYTQDAEGVEALRTYAESRGAVLSVTDEHRCPGYTVKGGHQASSLQAALRHLGVLGHKHIPHAYIATSRAQRVDLLAGLLDSDGHVNHGHGGTVEITLANEAMARQIKFLCDTLGYRTSLRSKRASIRAIGYEGTAWRVRFNGNVDEIPTRIDRKKPAPWTDGRDWTVTGVTLEDDGEDDYYGFVIDGNHRFLLEDGTVTHNTAFSLAVARNAALSATNAAGVAYFSLEMSADQLAQRLLTSEARVDAQAARTGRMTDQDWAAIARAAGRLSAAPIFIDDTPGLSILELRAKCRRLKAEHDIGLIIVDYLQLMHGSAGGKNANREQEIAQISRSLKALAKELDVPVIALSQLSRAVETRGGDKRPQLSDLRESGCLTGDTLVPLAGGERVRIRDLAGRDGAAAVVWAAEPETLRIGAAAVSRAFSTGVKPVYRLTTASGRTIRATANHKFLTLGGWARLDAIASGSHVAVPRAIPSADTATMTDDELALLGHLIGDGCTLPTHAVQYTTREDDLAAHVAHLASSVFGSEVSPRIVHEVPKGRESRWIQVYLASTRHHGHHTRSAVAEWLDGLGAWGLRSHEKHVPEAVFAQPQSSIAHFLRHLWATDGCIRLVAGASPRSAIYYATSSERLGRDVQSLLLRVGIVARLSRVPQGDNGRDQFHVIVSGRTDVLRFADAVGAVGAYKMASLAEVRAFAEARVENTNRDVIPREAWRSLVVPAMVQAAMTTRQMQARLGMQYCGTALYAANLSRTRAAAVAAIVGSEALARLAESDVYWDAVVSVVADGEEEVFDLTVPGPHNFVAGDIVVHNSIEQDADLVAFLYRAEKYGITTDDRGNSTLGIAEVILGKQRNGPLGSVEVAFINQYARFDNLSASYYDDGGGGGYDGGGGYEGGGGYDGGGPPQGGDGFGPPGGYLPGPPGGGGDAF